MACLLSVQPPRGPERKSGFVAKTGWELLAFSGVPADPETPRNALGFGTSSDCVSRGKERFSWMVREQYKARE